MFNVPEKYRLLTGLYGSHAGFGNNGAFTIPPNPKIKSRTMSVIASDQMGWEHVSVSLLGRQKELPSHNEMEYIKSLFWGDDCWVMELHPPRSEYVNNHPCLHLWRPTQAAIPTPPSLLVGFK